MAIREINIQRYKNLHDFHKSFDRTDEPNYLPNQFYGKYIKSFWAIIGNNGSGKTNLIELIAGVATSDKATIDYFEGTSSCKKILYTTLSNTRFNSASESSNLTILSESKLRQKNPDFYQQRTLLLKLWWWLYVTCHLKDYPELQKMHLDRLNIPQYFLLSKPRSGFLGRLLTDHLARSSGYRSMINNLMSGRLVEGPLSMYYEDIFVLQLVRWKKDETELKWAHYDWPTIKKNLDQDLRDCVLFFKKCKVSDQGLYYILSKGNHRNQDKENHRLLSFLTIWLEILDELKGYYDKMIEQSQNKKKSYEERKKYDERRKSHFPSPITLTIASDLSHDKASDDYKFSTGEDSWQLLFARIIRTLKKELALNPKVFIILDEIENALHLTGQQNLIYALIHTINKCVDLYKDDVAAKDEIEVHLLLTSHSCFIPSDIPQRHVTYLGKKKKAQPFNAYANNMHDILRHSFINNNPYFGSFSRAKIDTIVSKIEEHRKSNTSIEEEVLRDLKLDIQLIGDKKIREALADEIKEFS